MQVGFVLSLSGMHAITHVCILDLFFGIQLPHIYFHYIKLTSLSVNSLKFNKACKNICPSEDTMLVNN